jgi:hypothetical protein
VIICDAIAHLEVLKMIAVTQANYL